MLFILSKDLHSTTCATSCVTLKALEPTDPPVPTSQTHCNSLIDQSACACRVTNEYQSRIFHGVRLNGTSVKFSSCLFVLCHTLVPPMHVLFMHWWDQSMTKYMLQQNRATVTAVSMMVYIAAVHWVFWSTFLLMSWSNWAERAEAKTVLLKSLAK